MRMHRDLHVVVLTHRTIRTLCSTVRTLSEIRIPTEHAARAYGAIKGYGTLKKDEWRADGSWHGVIEMPAGAYAPLVEKLGEITRGTAEAKIM